MSNSDELYLYEEMMLLSLRDEQGTFATSYVEYAVAGAVMAELLLEQHITVDDTKKQHVHLTAPVMTGDPIIDECIGKIKEEKKPKSLKDWVSKLAGIKELKHKVAQQLVNRGILKADKDKVLKLFTRRIYPEINPVPEQEIIERLGAAIFTDEAEVDARTAVLVSLANGTGVLKETFAGKELKSRKDRIEHVINGDLTGQATKEVIEAIQTAVIVAAIMPAVITTTTAANS